MFNKDFYPTPSHVISQMIAQTDILDKVILEPSAGKGDIVDYLKDNGCGRVLAYEINENLRTILSTKCQILGNDFLKSDPTDYSHVDMIIMNPPFHNADKHIIHAFNNAPEGCEIIALCNQETVSKDYRYGEFGKILQDYGTHDNLGNCFNMAERSTNVDVALIRLYKPVINEDSAFEGFFMDEDPEEHSGGDGIIQYNEVRALVNRYVGAVKIFDELAGLRDKLGYTTAELGLKPFAFKFEYNDYLMTKEEFSKYLQKKSWNYIFDKMNMRKYLTSGAMAEVNNFVEQQHNIPFTMKNVYRMFEIIVGTRQQTFDRALEEVIDKFTKHYHENRFNVEGWKTNSGHMLNKKFIIDYMVEPRYSGGVELCIGGGQQEKLTDLVKVLCNLTGTDFNTTTHIRDFFHSMMVGRLGLDTNRWYSWAFFEFKVFKKGTMHLKFQNEEHWYLLNKAYGELKGFSLPEKYSK